MTAPRLLVVVLAMLVPIATHASQHKWVAGDALDTRECYILQAPETIMWVHRHFKKAGAWIVARGKVICVREVDRSRSQLWYKVLLIKIGTLDRSQHVPAWVNSADLMEHGVMLSH